MGELTKVVKEIFTELDKFFASKDEVREELIRTGRDIIRSSKKVVSALLVEDFRKAEEELTQMKELVEGIRERLRDHPEVGFSGTAYNAFMEFVEAYVLYNIITKREIPKPGGLRVHPIPYVLGILDALGELKRYAINYVRRGDLQKAWEIFTVMEKVFNEAKLLEYPEGLIPGYRRKLDSVRATIESLRYFLTDMESRHKLIEQLKATQKRS